MGVSKVHSCAQQVKVAEGSVEPPGRKCRCRKYIGIAKATQMVKNGEASWIVIGRRWGPMNVPCHLCNGNPEVQNCACCKGKGTEVTTIDIEDYGNDIVLVSRHPADKKERKRSSALAQKTPRVATIEAKHIFRAYVENVRPAQQRIEEYGRQVHENLSSLIVGFEPADNPKTGEGRRYDYGRTI